MQCDRNQSQTQANQLCVDPDVDPMTGTVFGLFFFFKRGLIHFERKYTSESLAIHFECLLFSQYTLMGALLISFQNVISAMRIFHSPKVGFLMWLPLILTLLPSLPRTHLWLWMILQQEMTMRFRQFPLGALSRAMSGLSPPAAVKTVKESLTQGIRHVHQPPWVPAQLSSSTPSHKSHPIGRRVSRHPSYPHLGEWMRTWILPRWTMVPPWQSIHAQGFRCLSLNIFSVGSQALGKPFSFRPRKRVFD